jgi:hypothetical protein
LKIENVKWAKLHVCAGLFSRWFGMPSKREVRLSQFKKNAFEITGSLRVFLCIAKSKEIQKKSSASLAFSFNGFLMNFKLQ